MLIVPLLHKRDGTQESERWPERPAAGIARFYRDTYRARVEWLPGIRLWTDYYRQIEQLAQQSAIFDRIILIGHGGFDGPILDRTLVRSDRVVVAGVATLTRGIEPQPGLQESVTITYDIAGNRAFSEFIATHWQELLKLGSDPVREIEALEARFQPLDPDCARRCLPDAAGDSGKIAACEWVCRDPLFSAKSAEGLAPDRFMLFATGLRKLVSESGLIVIDSCNPGTLASKGEQPSETDGALVHSDLAGGPHPSYVHLLAAATGRAVAGPIGKISADDMTVFIAMLESKRRQRDLRLVFPAAKDMAQ
ncbi:hypothetical protein [Methylococcus sp. EFPC2]|uniref:hypothetical protein n=1 Tax=Methylococcus sp. EFPC2 TaxID=2812648 RepID=UPI00196744F4|nr:hypothetical protein [Methylococcus sp. EFPC2]QSA97758.1 hypothetical protein JWZ97_02690 [Methylococcus sp. EFPC2]